MNLTQEKALYHLTGKLALNHAGFDLLQKLADESPYFAPAQFLLTAGLKKQAGYEQWMKSAQKTNLYFTNPLWLQYQLENIHMSSFKEDANVELKAKELFSNQPQKQANKAVDAVREEMRMPSTLENTQEDTDYDEPVPDEYVEEKDASTEPLSDETEAKISGILSNQLADFKKPLKEDAVLDIDTEQKKLHTIDYFASQGIKVDLSAIPQDKLTTHLLKFTDWLKQVKTANQQPTDLGTNLEMEKAVAETAKNSNQIREIVTESMADVLVKQGQADKAIQLYIKLSFLNPEKSSYFAAKIEQLKGI